MNNYSKNIQRRFSDTKEDSRLSVSDILITTTVIAGVVFMFKMEWEGRHK